MDYKDKYIKYKTKYLELKNEQIGGNNKNLIIHICGASGSGKTTLGNKLKEQFKNKIVVKDLDDLRDEHISKTYDINKNWTLDEIKYQKYIDEYINKQTKPLIFVGLNDNPRGLKKIYYNVHSHYNFFIDLDDNIIHKQKCLRLLNDIQNDKQAMNDLMNNNDRFLRGITFGINHECNLKNTIKENNKLKKYYETVNYKFMSRENIYKSVVKILNNSSL
jgi:adenylate kinase family enzyme